MSTTLSIKEHTARKVHACEWCGESIMPGEKYKAYAMIFQGDFSYSKMHSDCYSAAEEDIRECIYPEYEFEPGEHARGSRCIRGYEDE